MAKEAIAVDFGTSPSVISARKNGVEEESDPFLRSERKRESADLHKVSGHVRELSLEYYRNVCTQDRRSFLVTIALQVVTFVLFGVALKEYNAHHDVAYLTGVVGALSQILTVAAYRMHDKTTRQFTRFHICLERTHRFLLADSLCEHITAGEIRDSERAALIRAVIAAPLLTAEVIDGKRKFSAVTSRRRPAEPVANSDRKLAPA